MAPTRGHDRLCRRFPVSLCLALFLFSGCTSSLTVSPAFQPLPTLAALETPNIELEKNGFRFCYLDLPCEMDGELSDRYQTLMDEFFPVQEGASAVPPHRVKVITNMHLVNNYQGRLFSYGLLFGPLAFIAPIPFPMALDFSTVSTILTDDGQPIRTYRSRQLLEFWTYSAWGVRDPKLTEAAMRHHLRSLTRHLQFDAHLYRPAPPTAETGLAPAESPSGPTSNTTADEPSG